VQSLQLLLYKTAEAVLLQAGSQLMLAGVCNPD